MRRRIFFRTLLGAQFLIFLFLFGSGIYLLWLTRSSAILSEQDAADSVHGLRLAAAVCLGTCLVWGASFVGILKRQPWGWWLGLVANSFVFAILAYGVASDEGRVDAWDWLVPAVFLVVTVIQLLSRPSSWTAMELEGVKEAAAKSAGSGI
jgi:hypothetical protein